MRKLLFTGCMFATLSLLLTAGACAQTSAPATAPGQTSAPAAATDPAVLNTLKLLEERGKTLKDFTGKISFDTTDTISMDNEGTTGTVNLIVDPQNGPEFTAALTRTTVAGKPKHAIEQSIIFDGVNLTRIDFMAKTFDQVKVLPSGAKPGEATSLNGQIPLPIGLKTDEVLANFDVSPLPSKNPDQTQLRLVPKNRQKFNFTQLDITVDNKLQLPIKMITSNKEKETTLEFKETQINTGQAKMQSADAPKGAGWKITIK
jgi:outer membrane lipoprotein-sorting protein